MKNLKRVFSPDKKIHKTNKRKIKNVSDKLKMTPTGRKIY